MRHVQRRVQLVRTHRVLELPWDARGKRGNQAVKGNELVAISWIARRNIIDRSLGLGRRMRKKSSRSIAIGAPISESPIESLYFPEKRSSFDIERE